MREGYRIMLKSLKIYARNIYNNDVRYVVAYDYTKKIQLLKKPTKLKKSLVMSGAVLKNLCRIINGFRDKKGVVLPQVELVLTTRCTLRCKNCSNLMQFYGNDTIKPYDVDLKKNKHAIYRMLKAVDRINTFNLLGGEPFLYKDIGEIISYLGKQEKIGQIEVTTNGTVVPDDSVCRIMADNRVIVHISNYGSLSRNVAKLKENLRKHGVVFRELFLNSKWIDPGDMRKRGRSEDELKQQFKSCGNECRSLLDGHLHRCPRSSHGMDLEFIPDIKENYVDLLDKRMSLRDLRRKIKRTVLDCEFIIACDYCDFGISPIKEVVPGEQV